MSHLMDILLATAALLVLSPLLAVAAAANWILTRRVVFRQVRIGLGLMPFTMFKLQTMVDRPVEGSTVTVAGDPRVTWIGRLLRTTKVDELPQLVNVLRGEMSLVGPRALPANEVARVPEPLARKVYAVRPGMTGMASLLATDEERMLAGIPDPEEAYFRVVLPRKMWIESLYVERKGLGLDVLILALTPLAIVRPDLARGLFLRLVSPGLSLTLKGGGGAAVEAGLGVK